MVTVGVVVAVGVGVKIGVALAIVVGVMVVGVVAFGGKIGVGVVVVGAVVVVKVNKMILPKNYTCLACLQMRSSDGVCVERQIIATGKCKLYDPILGRHELHKKITGE